MQLPTRTKWKGFTLVELIVVITILAILSTISFITYTGMSSDARNSVRKTDMSEMKVRLRGIAQKMGAFPLPSTPITLSNSGTSYVSQGWSDTIETDNGSSFRADPKTNRPYLYATTANRQSYQIGMTLEQGAGKYSAYVDGDYTPLAPYVFPSLLIATTSSGNFEIHDGIGAGTANRADFIVNNGTLNLPYDMNGKATDGTAATFSGIIQEANVRLPWSSNYSSCQAIYEAGKSMGPGDYLIIDNSGALTMTGCTMAVASPPPAAPMASAVTGTTGTGITWNWQASAGATRYEFSTNGSSWSDKGNVLAFSETWLGCGTSYTRYVHACNADGCGSSTTLGPTNTNACRGEQLFTTVGTNVWTVPNGVTSVSVVCVGGGGDAQNVPANSATSGGGGGGLVYGNNIAVVSGTNMNVVVGGRGGNSTFGTMVAGGGGAGIVGNNAAWWAGGTYSGGNGGGNGGAGGSAGTTLDYSGGGGGAGGYGGAGGAGGSGAGNVNRDGANGAGGGGGGGTTGGGAGGGGGVGLFGAGANGLGGLRATFNYTAGGGGGSGGGDGTYPSGGSYGGGSGMSGSTGTSSPGACRIIWPGNSRSFPSTDAGA